MDTANQISELTEGQQSLKEITVIGKTGVMNQCFDVRKSVETSFTPHEVKMKTVTHLPLPPNNKSVRKFLGMAKLKREQTHKMVNLYEMTKKETGYQ